MESNLWQIIQYTIFPMLLWLIILSITLRQLTKKQSVSAMLSWLMIIYLVPIVGVIAYLIFGEITLGKTRAKAFETLSSKYKKWFDKFGECQFLIHKNNSLSYKSIFELTQNRLGIPCILGNELHILDTPENIMDNIIKDINQAQYSINMVFYIWHNGGRVDEVMKALIAARKRNVNIKLLLDSVGSHDFLGSVNYYRMKSCGIEIAEALHVNLFRMFLRRLDLRQHRKIIVIDNQIAYTGSMNMVDPNYFKQDANVGKWIDIMVRIDGPVSPVLNGLHAWDWEIETQTEMIPELPQCPTLPLEKHHSHAVQILATGPSFPDDLMAQVLATAIFSAQKNIVITSPYFVPSHSIAESLRIAALRGVEVRLILPKKNDSVMVGWASRTFFEDLMAAGVKIYQFEKGLLHTKSILIDNTLALVGTVNMDMRSFMLNFEVTMIVEDHLFANEIAQLHQHYLQNTTQLNYEIWRQRSLISRIIEKIFFIFSPLL